MIKVNLQNYNNVILYKHINGDRSNLFMLYKLNQKILY